MAPTKGQPAVQSWSFLLVTFLAVLIVFSTGFFYYYYQRDQLRTLTRNNLTVVANLKVDQIENWLSERLTDARIIYDNSLFFDPLLSWLADKRAPVLEKEIKAWMASFCGDIGYSGISLLDRQGRTTIYYLKRGEGELEYENDKIEESLRENKIIIGDFHRSPQGVIMLNLYIPIRGHKLPAGLLVLHINPKLFLYPLIQTWPGPSETAETLLVRREGNDIVYLNELRHKKDTVLKLRFPIGTTNLPAAMVARGVSDLILGRDYRGHAVLAVGRPIPGTSWYIIAKIDTSEIYATMIWIGVRASAFAALIIVLLGAGLYLRVSRHSEAELKASKEAFERLVSASPDAVAALDLDGKIIYVSEETLKMNGAQNQEELLGKSGFDLIAPQDREAALAAFKRTLKTGRLESREYAFLRKDGSQFIGEVNAAMTRTIEGSPAGLILTIRDITSKKTMERIIKEGAVKFEALFDNMSSGVVIYQHRQNESDDFIISDINRAVERIEKVKRAEVIGRNVLDVFPGVKAFGLFDAFLRVSRTGQPEHLPVTLYQDQRISGWRENYVYKLPTGEIVAVYNDVTERKQAEDALKVSEVRYRRLFEAAKDGILILNADTGTIIDANPYLINLLGFSLEQFQGKTVWEIGFLKDVIKNKDNFLELQQKGFIRYEDLPLETAGGQLIDVEFVSNVYQVNHHRVIQCNIRNITERKQAEAALALQNFHLQKSQELAQVGSWNLDLKNDVLIWTDETYRIFGVPIGMPLTYEKFLGLVHPDDRERVDKAWQAALAHNDYDLEHRIIVTGQVKWVREKAELQFDEEGKASRGIGAVLDITEYKRLVSIRDEFVNTVSHELRTPMAIIHEGVAQVLEGIHGPVNEEQSRFLSTTERSIDRLGRIIDNLLDISRLESGKMEARKEPIDFAGLARETAAIFRPQIEKKGLEFIEHIPANPVRLSADRDELTEVLTNLLGNALKFTDKGRIELTVIERSQEIECAIADTGRGIAADQLPKLFEKFTQFGRVAGAGEKGTGLGLAIAKSLIELHDGKIFVEAAENRGMNITFILPKNL
jgi:PAS domain S-box-containing protein